MGLSLSHPRQSLCPCLQPPCLAVRGRALLFECDVSAERERAGGSFSRRSSLSRSALSRSFSHAAAGSVRGSFSQWKRAELRLWLCSDLLLLGSRRGAAPGCFDVTHRAPLHEVSVEVFGGCNDGTSTLRLRMDGQAHLMRFGELSGDYEHLVEALNSAQAVVQRTGERWKQAAKGSLDTIAQRSRGASAATPRGDADTPRPDNASPGGDSASTAGDGAGLRRVTSFTLRRASSWRLRRPRRAADAPAAAAPAAAGPAADVPVAAAPAAAMASPRETRLSDSMAALGEEIDRYLLTSATVAPPAHGESGKTTRTYSARGRMTSLGASSRLAVEQASARLSAVAQPRASSSSRPRCCTHSGQTSQWHDSWNVAAPPAAADTRGPNGPYPSSTRPISFIDALQHRLALAQRQNRTHEHNLHTQIMTNTLIASYI